jgi:hypothetical protein
MLLQRLPVRTDHPTENSGFPEEIHGGGHPVISQCKLIVSVLSKDMNVFIGC